MAHRAGSWRPRTLQPQLLAGQTPLLSLREQRLIAKRLAGFGLLSLLAVAATMTLQSALSTCTCPRVSRGHFIRTVGVPSTPQPEVSMPLPAYSSLAACDGREHELFRKQSGVPWLTEDCLVQPQDPQIEFSVPGEWLNCAEARHLYSCWSAACMSCFHLNYMTACRPATASQQGAGVVPAETAH